MLKFLLIFISTILLTNCSFKKVDKHHGVPFLEEKQKLLVIDETNKNEIRKILGSPSSTSLFDNDVWIYVERKLTQSELKNFGRMKLIKNDVLVLEIDNKGILKSKSFYNIDDMENVQMVEATTIDGFRKKTYVYDFMSSMRQKMNDPLGMRAKKRRELNQR
jgi:outer membrane protein assembly factor BamE (lipoprotein component of BamABCDE complex)